MIAPVNTVNGFSDPEYIRILNELMRFGISSSGNKTVDKSKLEQAKTELIQKIQVKQDDEQKQNLQVVPSEGVQDAARANLEETRLGAMTLAELNKIYFGIS